MKRLKLLIIIAFAVSLTGCMQDYNYDEEYSDAIAEYMAGMILSNDKDYTHALVTTQNMMVDNKNEAKETLVKDNNKDTTTEGINTQGSVAETGQDNNVSQNNATISDIINNKNFDINYIGYHLTDTYPEDPGNTDFVLMPRGEEYQLLVVDFQVKNKTKSKKELNLIKSELNFQLKINDETVYKPLLTLLENNLQYIDIDIEGGKSEKVLLIFEVSKIVKISDINLTISDQNKSAAINMK